MNFKKLRLFMVYLLSFLLGFEPAVLAAKSEETNWKKVVADSGLSKKDLKLADFYAKNWQLFPRILQADIEEVLRNDPDTMMPAIDFNKVGAPGGGQNLQASFSVDGRAISMTLVSSDQTLRLNDQKISYEDLYNGIPAIQKFEKGLNLGVTLGTQVQKGDFRLILIAHEDLMKLSAEDRTDYLNGIRDLVVTSQKVFSTREFKGPQTSSHWLFRTLIESAQAVYEVGKACVVAGHVSTYAAYQRDDEPSLKELRCGGNNPGEIAKLRDDCAQGEIRCNNRIYGKDLQTGRGLCVSKINATESCEAFVTKSEWKPTKSDWQAFASESSNQLSIVENECVALSETVDAAVNDLEAYERKEKNSKVPAATGAAKSKKRAEIELMKEARESCRQTHHRIDWINGQLGTPNLICTASASPASVVTIAPAATAASAAAAPAERSNASADVRPPAPVSPSTKTAVSGGLNPTGQSAARPADGTVPVGWDHLTPEEKDAYKPPSDQSSAAGAAGNGAGTVARSSGGPPGPAKGPIGPGGASSSPNGGAAANPAGANPASGHVCQRPLVGGDPTALAAADGKSVEAAKASSSSRTYYRTEKRVYAKKTLGWKTWAAIGAAAVGVGLLVAWMAGGFSKKKKSARVNDDGVSAPDARLRGPNLKRSEQIVR